MEENEGKTVKLSTVIIILAIVIILVLGFFLYKFYNDKVSMTKKATELQSQVNTLNITVSELENKVKGLSENLVTSTNNVSDNISTENISNQSSSVPSDQEGQKPENYEDYIGEWYEAKVISDVADDPHNNPNSLKIISANGNEITFELYVTRTATFQNVAVTISNGIGNFEATDSHTPSKDHNISKVSGSIEFLDGIIHIKIEQSNLLYLDSGTEFYFCYKRD